MVALADRVGVVERFARSANLERDAARTEPLDGYVVTARALDVIQRVTGVAESGRAGGAWSLTGPYGSGKSSLALLLDAAFGPAGPTRDAAMCLISATSGSPGGGGKLKAAHGRYGTEQQGFHRGLVTADREPLARTVLRALHTAVCRSFGKIPPASRFPATAALKHALNDASSDDPRRSGPSASALVEIARALAADRPLMLVIDEFGKNLEAVADRATIVSSGDGSTDPYLLQQLAEAGQGDGLPIFLLTLQHQSFDDYLTGVDTPQRREWAKVQGRFEDIAYVESPAQTRALIGSVFEVNDEKLQNRIDRWARSQAQTMQSLGVADLADPQAVASCWPLQPITAVVLSELCQRYGQHERTLFSFLTGPEVAGADGFLATTSLAAKGAPPTLGLDAVYDYFVAAGGLSSVAAASSSRWIEIATRLRDTHGLSHQQMRVAKAVAMLNLVATSGTIRASAHVLELAEAGAQEILDELTEAGVLTYRTFADEYRVWQGTDVDIRSLQEASRVRVQQQPLVEIVSSVDEPSPVVAARHSAINDCLRVFSQRYADSYDKAEPLDAFSPFDGEVLLMVDGDQLPLLAAAPTDGAKPTVAALPSLDRLAGLDSAARELASLMSVLDEPVVASDRVARHELNERLAVARALFDQAAFAAFKDESCQWLLLTADGEIQLDSGRGSAALSDAADRAYSHTPVVPNEILNRTKLTTQGAKAQRLLIEAMIQQGDQPNLGLEGYGPEVAMYKAVLAHTRLHAKNKDTGLMEFRAPSGGGQAAKKLLPAWEALNDEFERARQRRVNLSDIWAVLRSPPIGMKAGVVPVLVMAGLLAYRDEIAVYEHGTFQPRLTGAIAERIVRNPNHFDIKHFASTTGGRRKVVEALAKHLGLLDARTGTGDQRVRNVLHVVSGLVTRVRNLETHTRQTADLSPQAQKVRDAVVAAVQPDDLLFTELPKALGLPEVSDTKSSYAQAIKYAETVALALEELEGCFAQVLGDSLKLLINTSSSPSRQAVAKRAAGLDADVLDQTIRPFILALANTGVDDDLDWIKIIATVVAQKAPAEWSDEDKRRFFLMLPEQIAAFERLVALYGFEVELKVTFTRPDGREHIHLVDTDHAQKAKLAKALNQVIAEAEKLVGPGEQAHNVLFSLLTERLLEGASHD